MDRRDGVGDLKHTRTCIEHHLGALDGVGDRDQAFRRRLMVENLPEPARSPC